MSEQKRFVFVVNPRSAAGATLRRFEAVRQKFASRLAQQNGIIDVKLTERPRHATELAREAVTSGADVVVAVGGDGTNNEVVNGFFDVDGKRIESKTAFSVVTSGTGGDFRRAFGWSTEPMDDLERLARMTRRRIDLGRMVCVDDKGAPVLRHFVNISSFGMSGVVVDVVNKGSKKLGAKLSFMAGSVKTMATYKPQTVQVSLDDGAPVTEEISLVAVCNGQYFGGGMWVAPDSVPDDGLFDAVVVRGGGLGFWIKHGLKIYTGRHKTLPEVRIQRCKKVHAAPSSSSEKVFIDLDGEQPGLLPATWDIVPAAIDLLI
jgi:YegS/Rv2252/BmrU family lipid kinase